MGIMVGEVTSQSALVQVRLTGTEGPENGDVPGLSGKVQFTLSASDGSGKPLVKTVAADADHDFIARADFTELEPDRPYVCTTQIGTSLEDMSAGPVAHFTTHPGKHGERAVSFVVVTGMNYAKFHGDKRIDRVQHLLENNRDLPQSYQGEDKQLGYPALETILHMAPDFFIGTGDNVYYDTPDNPRAETAEEMRQKWHEQFVQPRYVQLFAAVPTFWEIDDHDYRVDDGDNSGDHAPSPELGRAMMLEQLPLAATHDTAAKTYRTHRVSRDLQIWLVENRMHRSDNATPDGPEKTIWGVDQKQWLMQTLKESDAAFKVLVSPTPMIGPDDKRKTDNHTNLGGFRHERDEFFSWVKESGIRHLYLVCGDRHWQYHALHPSGMEEFSCGALVDANSRLGRKPGDPASTDPKGEIQQIYTQDRPSGGFLLIQCAPQSDKGPTLTFTHYDELGKPLNEHRKLSTD